MTSTTSNSIEETTSLLINSSTPNISSSSSSVPDPSTTSTTPALTTASTVSTSSSATTTATGSMSVVVSIPPVIQPPASSSITSTTLSIPDTTVSTTGSTTGTTPPTSSSSSPSTTSTQSPTSGLSTSIITSSTASATSTTSSSTSSTTSSTSTAPPSFVTLTPTTTPSSITSSSSTSQSSSTAPSVTQERRTSTTIYLTTSNGQVLTFTAIETVVLSPAATSNASSPASTRGALNTSDNGVSSGFLSNSGAVAGVFTVVALLICGLIAAIGWFVLRKRRTRKLRTDERTAVGGAGAGGAGVDRFGEDEFENQNPFAEGDHVSGMDYTGVGFGGQTRSVPEMVEHNRQSIGSSDVNGRSVLPGMIGYSLPPTTASNYHNGATSNGGSGHSHSQNGHESSGGSRGSHELLNSDRVTPPQSTGAGANSSQGNGDWMIGNTPNSNARSGSQESHGEPTATYSDQTQRNQQRESYHSNSFYAPNSMNANMTAEGNRYSTLFAPTLPGIGGSPSRPGLYSNDSEASLNYERGKLNKLGVLRIANADSGAETEED